MQTPEHIVCAAVRDGGEVFAGRAHFYAYQAAAEARNADLDAIYQTFEEGFQTNTGRFVGREEAFTIANAAQQYREDTGEIDTFELACEHLVKDARFCPA